MTIRQIKQVFHAEPFQPFVFRLADGREVPVKSREFMAFSPRGRTIAVFQPDDSLNILDLHQVTDIEVKKRPRRRPARPAS